MNVQALSGSLANFCVLTGLLNPHERIMSLDYSHGGDISHGYEKGSATTKYFDVLNY